jgi:hypothetical protein
VAAGGSTDGLRSTFTSTAGGVMTEEAGAVTGDLELLTRPTEAGEGSVEVVVGYAGTEEWYTVSGSPAPMGGGDLHASHEALLARLKTPGPVEDGNELPVDLLGQ